MPYIHIIGLNTLPYDSQVPYRLGREAVLLTLHTQARYSAWNIADAQ